MFRQSLQLAARQVSRRLATTRDNSWFRLAIVVMLTCLALPTPRAEAINITYTYDERSKPAFDSNGVELRRITDAAIAIWESYILDDVDYHFDLSWENLGGGTFGQHEDYLGWATSNILIDTHAPDGSLRNWFFDPTPFSNEEFSMNQTLVRDVDAADIDAGFSGNPHQNFEVGFNGFAAGTAAVGKLDLLSIVTHELGHKLGYSFNGPLEDYHDMNSATTGGRSLGVLQVGDYELNLDTVLQSDWASPNGGERRLPSATDILATWDESVHMTPGNGPLPVPTYTRFQYYNLPRVDFLEGNTNSWHNTINWLGGKVPGTGNEVFIRHGGTVVQSDGTSAAKSLQISDNSNLYVKGSKLYVENDTNVGKNLSRGDLNVGSLGDTFSTLETNNLFINNGIVNTYDSKGSVNVMRDLTIGSRGTLMGAGVTRVGKKLINNGKIEGGTFLLFGFGGTQTLMTSGAGATLDLDGNGSEQGEINAVIGDLKIYGPLSDDFNGRVGIGETRTMRFSRPWVMKGSLNFNGGADATKYATLSGEEITIGGIGGIVNAKGHSMISAPMILNGPAVVNLSAVQDTLVLAGTSTLRGGSFSGLGTLAIQGNTSVAMPNPLFPDDRSDEIGLALFSAVNTDAVNAGLELEVNPSSSPESTFVGNFTTYSLNVPLQMRSGGVMTASVSNLYLPKQTTMSGGQITGISTVNQVGNLVVDGNSAINPNTFLWGVDATDHRTTIRASKRLDLSPNRIVRDNGVQVYKGSIVLETGATLNVNTGVSDSWTMAGDLQMGISSKVIGDNLVNTGQVRGTGIIDVARFENAGHVKPGVNFGGLNMPNAAFVQTPVGVLDMTLGSSIFSNNASLLNVDTAQLAGTLSLSLMSGFSPAVGTIFDLLTADSISGQFSNVQFVAPFGSFFNGDVLYQSNKVSFRVSQISNNLIHSSDFNGDGVVDGVDLTAWHRAYGKVPSKQQSNMGDADGDGDVDGRDFLAWQREVSSPGKQPSPGRSFLTAVPEPSTMILGLVAILVACGKRSMAK